MEGGGPSGPEGVACLEAAHGQSTAAASTRDNQTVQKNKRSTCYPIVRIVVQVALGVGVVISKFHQLFNQTPQSVNFTELSQTGNSHNSPWVSVLPTTGSECTVSVRGHKIVVDRTVKLQTAHFSLSDKCIKGYYVYVAKHAAAVGGHCQ